MSAGLPARARQGRRVVVFAWISLAALQMLWHLWWFPSTDSRWIVTSIALVPLLLPLLALQRPTRALLWAGIVALIYFCHGISEAWSVPLERVPALLETGLSVVLVLALAVGFPKQKPPATETGDASPDGQAR